MENPYEILCYDKYRLGRVDGKFSSDMKKLLSTATPMTREDAENYNKVTNQSGILFVLNDEATEKFKEYQKKRKQTILENKAKKSIDAKELINSVFDTLLKERTEAGKTNEPTVAEMKAECNEKGYPKKEWQILNKSELIDYLKHKTE